MHLSEHFFLIIISLSKDFGVQQRTVSATFLPYLYPIFGYSGQTFDSLVVVIQREVILQHIIGFVILSEPENQERIGKG